MAAEYSSFAGWERNLRLSNDFVEVIVTLEVGPRIISYRPTQGRSVFKLVREEAGKSKEDTWKIRGGHRLWTAPEDFGEGAALFASMSGTDVATYTRERSGMSAFTLEDGAVYHPYSTYARGLDGLWGMYQWLDRAPKGRNETGVWWRRHDEY